MSITYGDLIDTLPIDNHEPTSNEKQLADSLFPHEKQISTVDRKNIILMLSMAILFFIFSYPAIRDVVYDSVKINNQFVKTAILTSLFVGSFFLTTTVLKRIE